MKLCEVLAESDLITPTTTWRKVGDGSWVVRVDYGNDRVFVHTNRKREALEKIVKDRYGPRKFVGEQGKKQEVIESVEQKLTAARVEHKKLKAQSLANPHLKPRIDRVAAEIKDLERKISSAPGQAKAAEEAREHEKKRAEAKASETTEEKKERFGKAVGHGLDRTNELRDKHGGWEGLASHVHKHVESATGEGKEKINAEHIAHHYDTTPRTVNRWLERKEFTKTARLLGRR